MCGSCVYTRLFRLQGRNDASTEACHVKVCSIGLHSLRVTVHGKLSSVSSQMQYIRHGMFQFLDRQLHLLERPVHRRGEEQGEQSTTREERSQRHATITAGCRGDPVFSQNVLSGMRITPSFLPPPLSLSNQRSSSRERETKGERQTERDKETERERKRRGEKETQSERVCSYRDALGVCRIFSA